GDAWRRPVGRARVDGERGPAGAGDRGGEPGHGSRDHLAALLRDDQTWSFTVPHGGLWLWLRLASTSGDDLAAKAAAAGLALLPGSGFSPHGAHRDRRGAPLPAAVPGPGRAVSPAGQGPKPGP